MNALLKTFIIGEMWLWSAWNLINPIFAIFVVSLPGGNIELTAAAVSAYMLVRVVVELSTGMLIAKSSDMTRLLATILGMFIMSAAYINLAYSNSIDDIFIFYSLLAFGLGFATPAKSTLFSSSLDHNKESLQWGLTDAAIFLSMGVASVIGGFVAHNFGFKYLFFLAAVVNILGTLPYFFYLRLNREALGE